MAATSSTCDKPQLIIPFSPMYSAYDGVHVFEVPAVVNGILPSAVSWTASDSTMVDLDPFVDRSGAAGVMVTARQPGTVEIVAGAGGLCGRTTLNITAASPDDWAAGNARYNDGVVLRPGPGALAGTKDAACTNCHGDTATNGPFRTVAHTPEQTGGFSDSDLIQIFRNGMIPPGGYFDPSIVPLAQWQTFHRWQMTDQEAKGLVVYLRSLTPAPQKGSSNFGGRFTPGDGSRPSIVDAGSAD
jgi:hypothetical protein